MRLVTRVLIVAALAFSLGCASKDWIDRTLVTVDVTGTWAGEGASARDIVLELEQNGSTVKGLVKSPSGGGTKVPPGPIEGTVAGDVFRFRNSRGNVEGELTVSGDEMDGRASIFGGSRPIFLRRVDSSSRPGSPTR